MRSTSAAIAIGVALFVVSSAHDAAAQQVKKSTVSGTIMSASALIPATGTAPLFTTPASGFFIVTQACHQFSAGSGRIVGNTFGDLPLWTGSGIGTCTTYSPGIALPPNETLTCHNPSLSPDIACSITGVLSSH